MRKKIRLKQDLTTESHVRNNIVVTAREQTQPQAVKSSKEDQRQTLM